MPIRVEIEGKGKVAEFPDGTDPAVIDAAIKRDYFPGSSASSPPPAPDHNFGGVSLGGNKPVDTREISYTKQRKTPEESKQAARDLAATGVKMLGGAARGATLGVVKADKGTIGVPFTTKEFGPGYGTSYLADKIGASPEVLQSQLPEAAGAILGGFATGPAIFGKLSNAVSRMPYVGRFAPVREGAIGSVTGAAMPREEGQSILAPFLLGGVLGTAGGFAESAGRAANAVRGIDGDGIVDKFARRIAGKTLDEARTKKGIIAERAATNQAETARISEEIPGWKVGMGQATDDPQVLAMQRRINMNNDAAKSYNAELEAQGNMALRDYLDTRLPSGSVDDFIASIGQRKDTITAAAGRAKNMAEDVAAGLEGESKLGVGQGLRDQALDVVSGLKSQARDMYGQVPRDLKTSSEPLYRAIQEMGAEAEPAFQRLGKTPFNTMRRAENALAPEPMPILGPDGLPYNSAQVDLDIPQEITFGQLMEFREQVGRAAREARASGNDALARNYYRLLDATKETIDLAGQTGKGEAAAALKAANDFYRNTYVPVAKQGATAKVLKRDSTSAYRVEPAMVGKQYFQPGPRGFAGAESFNRTFGNNQEARQLMRDYAAQDLLSFSRNPQTGQVEGKRVAVWMNRHKDALDGLNLSDEFTGLKEATRIAENAKARESEFLRSRFARAIDRTDPEKAVEYIFAGENSNQPKKVMRELLNMIRGDEMAVNGLKRTFSDMMTKKIQGMAKDQMVTFAEMQRFFNKYRGAMDILYSKEEIAALRNVQRAVEIRARINKAPSGVAGSQTADLRTTAGQMVKGYLPLDPKMRVLRVVFNRMEEGLNKQVDEYLARAMYDPEVAKQLINTARIANAKGANEGAKVLKNNIQALFAVGNVVKKVTGYTWQNGELVPNEN